MLIELYLLLYLSFKKLSSIMTIVFVLRLSCYFVKILSCWYEFYGVVKNTNDLKSIYITIFTEYKNQNMIFQLLHIHHSNDIPSNFWNLQFIIPFFRRLEKLWIVIMKSFFHSRLIFKLSLQNERDPSWASLRK